MNKTEQRKKAMLEALEKTLGVVSSACRAVGIGRTQYYNWLKEDQDFKEAVQEIENVALDFAESQLHKQIKEGSTSATIFFLKTKGKARGYVERIEYESKEVDEFTDYTDDELRDRLKNLRKKRADK